MSGFITKLRILLQMAAFSIYTMPAMKGSPIDFLYLTPPRTQRQFLNGWRGIAEMGR